MAINFVEHLASDVENGEGLRKGELMKLKLLLSAAEILEAGGYHNLRIADIIERAGVARGTFYIYFRDKSDVALQVLSDFRREMFSPRYVPRDRERWQDRVFLANLYFAELNQKNAGLLRSFYQYVDEADDFQKMRHFTERFWAKQQLAAFKRSFGVITETERTEVLRRIHAMRAMIEGVCRQVYIEEMPDMVEIFPTPFDIAVTSTKIWVGALETAQADSRTD